MPWAWDLRIEEPSDVFDKGYNGHRGKGLVFA